MNEDLRKVRLGKQGDLKRQGWQSFFVKPSGKFWKRYFNKRVRKGKVYKKDNWFEWS